MMYAKASKVSARAESQTAVGSFDEAVSDEAATADLEHVSKNNSVQTSEEPQQKEQVELRENLNETAFFYPQLETDHEGGVTLKFTLPESLTTWRLMGVAHTADMLYGYIDAETVAQKELMVQPNMPRLRLPSPCASSTQVSIF